MAHMKQEDEWFGGEEPLQPAAPAKRQPLSVTAAVRRATEVLKEHTFYITGEVSELSNKPGYKAVYFTIKDESSSLPCLMWKSRYEKSGVELFVGAVVEITGKFTIYAARGTMNFDVQRITLAGEGVLRQRVAQLAQKLKSEGLMDASRKRPVPAYPQTIGLVTSPRGAAVHDVLRTLRRRYPMARIVFAGIPVEGPGAAEHITAGLNAVAAVPEVELVLLVRGGGSFESLMPFNDEGLARAIAACPKPVVTGIGHEPDTSIADMVADLRQSTPTGAAAAVTPDVGELNQAIDGLFGHLYGSLAHRLKRSVDYLGAIESRPLFKDKEALLGASFQTADILQDRMERVGATLLPQRQERLGVLSQRLAFALPRTLDAARFDLQRCSASLKTQGQTLLAEPTHQVAVAQQALQGRGATLLNPYLQQAAVLTARLGDLSPVHALARGWSIVTGEQGQVVRRVADAKPDEKVTVQLTDGALACRVEGEVNTHLTELIAMEDSHDSAN